MKKILLFFLIFLGAITLFIPLISRSFLTRIALHKAEDLLQTHIELGSAELHLLQGSVILRNLTIFHPDRKEEKIAQVDKIALRLEYVPMIWGRPGSLVLKMDHPRFVYVTDRTGEWELARRLPLLRRGTGEKRLTPFNVDKVQINNGEVEYRDGKISAPPTVTQISDIDLDVTHLQLPTLDNRLPTKFESSLKIAKDGKFEMKGRGDFLSPQMSFDSEVQIHSLPLVPFAPYYEADLPIIIKDGDMSLTSQAKCEKDFLRAPAHVTLSHLEVEPKTKQLFGVTADRIVDSLKDKKGQIEMDTLISGNIRNPQFHVLTNFSGAFVKSLTQGLIQLTPQAIEGIGKDVGKGVESGFEKFKGLFKK